MISNLSSINEKHVHASHEWKYISFHLYNIYTNTKSPLDDRHKKIHHKSTWKASSLYWTACLSSCLTLDFSGYPPSAPSGRGTFTAVSSTPLRVVFSVLVFLNGWVG